MILVASPVTDNGVVVDALWIADRNAALKEAGQIKAISTDEQFAEAGKSVVYLKGLAKSIEESRKAVKDPVLALCKRIDDAAKETTKPIEAEAMRLSALRGKYQADKEEAERKRLAEIQRLEREKREAEEKAKREAEEALKKAESVEQAEEALQKADAAITETTKAVEAKIQAVAAPVPVSPKVAGLAIPKVWKFEVVDVEMLHKFNPQLVELTPRMAEIRKAINAGHTVIPGVKTWQEFQDRGTR